MSRISLGPDPDSARQAREFVALVVMQTTGREDLVEVAELLTSEVATNAIRHARTPFTVEVDVAADRLEVRVCDDDPELPVRRSVDADRVGGWGMHLVARLADAWGIRQVPDDGKCVWFELLTT